MKKQIIAAVCSFCICSLVQGQSEFLERQAEKAKNKVSNRIENKIDQGMEKALDETEEGIKETAKKKDKKDKKEKTIDSQENQSNDSSKDSEIGSKSDNKSSSDNSKGKSGASDDRKTATVYKKFDFVAGEKIIAYETFEETSLGDFPLGWNTNSSGELVRLDDSQTKWLCMSSDGFFLPEFIKELPENCTIEFDVFTRYRSNNMLTYSFYIKAVDSPKKDLVNDLIQNGFYFGWRPGVGSASYSLFEDGENISKNEGLSVKGFLSSNEEEPVMARVSIWRQKSRLRVYVNEDKILDLPQAFDSKLKYNSFKFGVSYANYSWGENDDEFMVSNLRYAVGAPDTRSKLITEGKLVSRGILFDTNSDQLKGESFGALKEIAQALNENADVKVKIIGHTDSDGDENSNLELSKKRAEAVKQSLIKDFNVAESRLSTDGKGESEPSEPNTTTAGKANNRRVEFIKL